MPPEPSRRERNTAFLKRLITSPKIEVAEST